MLLLAAVLSLAQPSLAQRPDVSIAILANAEDREALLGLLDSLGKDRAFTGESGMSAVGCVDAWRRDSAQTEACIRSRLPRDRAAIIINAWGPTSANGETEVTCVGAGGTGKMRLIRPAAAATRAALERCLAGAAPHAEPGPEQRYGVRFSETLGISDSRRAREAAVNVLAIAVDHVGYPRGIAGYCQVEGRVIGVVRGAGLSPRGTIELTVPCVAGPDRTGPRRISSKELDEGTFAELFLDERMELLDYRKRRD